MPHNDCLFGSIHSLDLHACWLSSNKQLIRNFRLRCLARVAVGHLRDSTQGIYESRWTKFTLWCRRWDLDPLQAPVNTVCDFLLDLFDKEDLSPSSIEGYRSTINSVWGVVGRSLVESFDVSQLIRSFQAERLRSQVNFPRWDLNLVLRVLSRPPFSSGGRVSPLLPVGQNSLPPPAGFRASWRHTCH